LIQELEKSKPVILTGDLNCAHEEIDIFNPAVSDPDFHVVYEYPLPGIETLENGCRPRKYSKNTLVILTPGCQK